MKKKLFGALRCLRLLQPRPWLKRRRRVSPRPMSICGLAQPAYPAVVVIPNGEPLTIHGCLSDTPWCDVSFSYGRGWVAGRYVQAIYRQNVSMWSRATTVISACDHHIRSRRYWDRYYRDRDFYRERDRWRRPPVVGTGMRRRPAVVMIAPSTSR